MTDMSVEQRMLIEWECTRLVNRFNLLNDQGDWEAAADCFAPDGSYLTPTSEVPLSGRDALIESFRSRPPWTFRHFATNIVVDAISPTEARGHSYLLLAFNSGADAAAPVTGTGLTGEVQEHFVLTDQGWRFGHRRGFGGIPFGTSA